MDNTEFFMELLDREREHGRMLQEETYLNDLLTKTIADALHKDETCDWSNNYRDIDKIGVPLGDIAAIIGYSIPLWLKTKAENIKKEREADE